MWSRFFFFFPQKTITRMVKFNKIFYFHSTHLEFKLGTPGMTTELCDLGFNTSWRVNTTSGVPRQIDQRIECLNQMLLLIIWYVPWYIMIITGEDTLPESPLNNSRSLVNSKYGCDLSFVQGYLCLSDVPGTLKYHVI